MKQKRNRQGKSVNPHSSSLPKFNKQNSQAQAPQPDPSGSEPSSDKKDDKVVDADFEEVDENKKD